MAAAFCQSASVDLSGSTPIAKRPKLAISWESDIMPTLPLYLGFHRSAMVGGVSTYFGLYAMPVMPEAHGML